MWTAAIDDAPAVVYDALDDAVNALLEPTAAAA